MLFYSRVDAPELRGNVSRPPLTCRDVKKKKKKKESVMWQLFTTAAAIIHDKWNLGHGSYSCVPDLQFQIGQRHSCMLAVTYCNEMKQKNKPSEDISFFFFF